MEPFHINTPSDNRCSQLYTFSPDDLTDIPHPDDLSDKEHSPMEEDSIELPPPPGTAGDDFPMPLPNKHQPRITSDSFSPFPNAEGSKNSSDADPNLMSESFNILPLSEDCQQKPDLEPDELVPKPMDIVEEARYSPSKADSDEENQDLVMTKPKVLGKEQAKKRLMAFSLSKQPSASLKKQNKAVTPVKNKEKPPNPNKASNVQEQFRATMSAIEEEKKKMFQNLPGYFLQDINDINKLHSSNSRNSDKIKSDKRRSENKASSSRDGGSSRSNENRRKRSSRRSRGRSSSRSRSKRRRRSRSQRRSRSRSKRKSPNRSQRNRSPSNKPREDKNYKSSRKNSREDQPKKKQTEESSRYKSSNSKGENDSKNQSNESRPRREEQKRSPSVRTEFKPIFNYLSKGCNPMTSLQAKPADSSNSTPISFPEKIVKFTRTKPIISWSENPSYATEFYMSKQMLLENCDNATSSILLSIIENKNIGSSEKQNESQEKENREWYPRENYLLTNASNNSESKEVHSSVPSDAIFEKESSESTETKKDLTNVKEEAKKKRAAFERKISLVNDSYMSDEEEQVKEMMVGEVKVQLDLDTNSVKVCSKWDSDYEGENNEKGKDSLAFKVKESPQEKVKTSEGLDSKTGSTEKKKSSVAASPTASVPPVEPPSLKSSDNGTGNLVSEYEEFLKMVSVDSSDVGDSQKEKILPGPSLKPEKPKLKKVEKSSEENRKSPRLGATDWDQESDREDNSKKRHFSGIGSHDEFSILKEEKDGKKESKKKKVSKKSEKSKEMKAKVTKKSGKTKKKKYEDSYSEDSSSESYDSDSSESSESNSSENRKKKKHSKSKKKRREESSSESDSDSDDSKAKKKKSKQKKGGKKKTGSSDEVPNVLLKQLDFKKQLIMKKIDEIDSMSEKSAKKKAKEGREKKKNLESSDGSDSEKYRKSAKKKKGEAKTEKEKKKSTKKSKLSGKGKKTKRSKSSSDSESETSEEERVKKKKGKKLEKKKKEPSEDSESEEKGKKPAKSKTGGKSHKKAKRSRKESSSSDSESEESSSSEKKEKKRKSDGKSDIDSLEITKSSLKDDFVLEEDLGRKGVGWDRKKAWKKGEGERRKRKEEDDWEASSSVEESEKESKVRESSWDDEILPREAKTQVPEEDTSKGDLKVGNKTGQKQSVDNSEESSDLNNQLSSGTLKNSLSAFSFNENSFCSFEQELSRDFFLTGLNYSNCGNESSKVSSIDPRPFQSVSKDAETKKASHSELYSPGHSDSEASDGEANKFEKPIGSHAAENKAKEVYDPLNSDSEGSVENKLELNSIPLPRVSDILLPGETKNFENINIALPSNLEGIVLKDLTRNDPGNFDVLPPSATPPKSSFSSGEFIPMVPSQSPYSDDKTTPTKKQVMSVKGPLKLVSKAASVFQDESDEENVEPLGKGKGSQKEAGENAKGKASEDSNSLEENSRDEIRKRHRDKSRERSAERSRRRKRSRSRERRSRSKSRSVRLPSPSRQKESAREKREIRSDSFEIEPLKSCIDSNELTDLVQPIPVLTGVETSDGLWTRSVIPSCDFPQSSDKLIDIAESFDIYPSEESTYRSKSCEKDFADYDEDRRSRKERRRSRSRSLSPRKKLRSKSPERRRSPRSKERSPASPRRRSPRRKSPSRRYRSSRSPDRRRKSRSRSPRKRRLSPSRRSRSLSPRKYKSPKHADDSPRRRDSSATALSPKERFSPRKDSSYPVDYTNSLQNRIPVIGASLEDPDRKLSPSAMQSPMFEGSVGYPRHMVDSSAQDPDMYNSFYEGEYSQEFGMRTYSKDVAVNNLITVKNHDLEKPSSSERLSLDQRIELELGAGGTQAQGDQYQVCPQFQDQNYFQNPCPCDSASGDNFYQNQNVAINDFNGQYFNGHQQQQGYRPFQQYPNPQPVPNSVMQVGNIVEVVPSAMPSKPPAQQIMQVGNVLQVVPSQKTVPPSTTNSYSNDSSTVKVQKATAVVAPSSVVPTPNPETLLSPLIKAIQLEREKRRKEKEKRKAEREARRKARQLRREAKLMLVNEKLKKSVQNEGLMLGQEVEDEELLDALDVPSPPIPVEIITVSSPNALPPAGKGILITAGFMPKPPSEKKEVKFADGVCPGEGTSTSGGEEMPSPPPKPKLPKEKRFKKKKTKVKKKVKVQIIRQIIQEEEDDDDDLSPPPPPPGDPPPVFFARFPFAGEAQFPVYQTQTTTTTLTTVQYPNQSFE